jgi:Fe-S-cluster containining protein
MATTDANPIPSVPSTGGAPSWPDSLAELRAEVIAGFLNSHERENADSARLLETTSFLYAAIELLAERGLISIADLNKRRTAVKNRLVKDFFDQGMGVVLLESEHADKYDYPLSAEIDCAARLQVCKGICCKLNFALSEQDVEEGILRWELGDPYIARKERDGYCHHLDRATHFCTVREHRPIPCRAYTCRNDRRIWQDFDNMVLAADLDAALLDREGSRELVRASRARQRDSAPMIEDGKG